jgi:hypothetical protein
MPHPASLRYLNTAVVRDVDDRLRELRRRPGRQIAPRF